MSPTDTPEIAFPSIMPAAEDDLCLGPHHHLSVPASQARRVCSSTDLCPMNYTKPYRLQSGTTSE